MIKLMRRQFMVAAVAGFAALSGAHAAEDAYPSKPITILMGFAAGSATDAAIRLIAPKMSEALKVPVIVENKPGANQTVAINALNHLARCVLFVKRHIQPQAVQGQIGAQSVGGGPGHIGADIGDGHRQDLVGQGTNMMDMDIMGDDVTISSVSDWYLYPYLWLNAHRNPQSAIVYFNYFFYYEIINNANLLIEFSFIAGRYISLNNSIVQAGAHKVHDSIVKL